MPDINQWIAIAGGGYVNGATGATLTNVNGVATITVGGKAFAITDAALASLVVPPPAPPVPAHIAAMEKRAMATRDEWSHPDDRPPQTGGQ